MSTRRWAMEVLGTVTEDEIRNMSDRDLILYYWGNYENAIDEMEAQGYEVDVEEEPADVIKALSGSREDLIQDIVAEFE